MTAPTPEQMAKLPQWAQQWIKHLEMERTCAIRALNSYVDQQTPSKIYWDDYLCTGEERDKGNSGPTNKRHYVQTDRLVILHAGVLLRISCHDGEKMHDNGIELQWTTPEGTVDMVAMVPKSFQNVTLLSHTNMRVLKQRVEHINERNSFTRFRDEMKQIARKNDDDFAVGVAIDGTGYTVTVTETADNHTILEGRGESLVLAIRDAHDNLDTALQSWGYTR